MSRRRDRAREALLDRIEDRLVDAPIGLHQSGPAACVEALAASGLDEDIAALWRVWDGLDLGNGEAQILSLAASAEATATAMEDGRIAAGDRVIGHYGRADLIVPADPWEAGGEVVLVEDDGQRAPYASSLLRLVLGLVAEMQLLYDDEGEYREGLFDEFGELSERAERRLLRRRLDFDTDAPFPRFRLAQLLRRAGELRGARDELEQVLRCAPEFAWAHFELGRTALELVEAGALAGDGPRAEAEARRCASESFAAAAERAEDPGLRALFLAWELRACEQPARAEALRRAVLELDPGFASVREAGLREAVADGERARARELLALGLAVAPRQLGLLELRAVVEAMPEGDEEAAS